MARSYIRTDSRTYVGTPIISRLSVSKTSVIQTNRYLGDTSREEETKTWLTWWIRRYSGPCWRNRKAEQQPRERFCGCQTARWASRARGPGGHKTAARSGQRGRTLEEDRQWVTVVGCGGSLELGCLGPPETEPKKRSLRMGKRVESACVEPGALPPLCMMVHPPRLPHSFQTRRRGRGRETESTPGKRVGRVKRLDAGGRL